MNYIMTEEEFSQLVSFSATVKSVYSPASTLRQPSKSESAQNELSGIDLLAGGHLTPTGEAIVVALLTPERVFETFCNAMTEMPVISYCFFGGGWTVLLREPYSHLVNIIHPVAQEEISACTMQNLFPQELPAFENFRLTLTAPEAAVFELSHFVIEQRFIDLGRPLKKEEQSFTASDVFDEKNLLKLSLKLGKLPEAGLAKLAPSIYDAGALVTALLGLAQKGVLSMKETTEGAHFLHTEAARKWLMGDALLDTISVKNVLPPSGTEFYHLMKAGLLRISQQGDTLLYESVPTPTFETIRTVAVTPEVSAAILKDTVSSTVSFCSECGSKLDSSSRFCANCGAQIKR